MMPSSSSDLKWWHKGLTFLLIVLLCAVVLSDPALAKKKKKAARAPQPSSSKYAALVIEADTGAILHETNSRARRYPASLTKMMTLYLTFQALESGKIRLETSLPVSANAANQSPSKLGLKAGQTIRVYDAIMGVITESANDAAVVLAEALGGSVSGFAKLMGEQAHALGMEDTVFQNPNGLPDNNQFTTAQDMAKLGYGLIHHYPGFYPYFGRKLFIYKGRAYDNHNHLMERYQGMDGIKTGYIRASGFNLVASAERNGQRLIGVVFGGVGAKARDNQMEKLLDDGFARLRSGGLSSYAALPLPSKAAVAFPSRYAPPPERRVAVALPKKEPPAPTTPPAATAPLSPPQLPVTAPQAPRPATPTAPVPPLLPASGETVGGWGIQVGAYSDITAAQKALAEMASSLSTHLARAEQSLQKITMSNGSAVYRARFTGLDQATAREACNQLITKGQGCLVVTGP